MKTHKDLDVWKMSVALVTEIYKLTSKFPKEELFGLSSQMRRASVSIPSNIAEDAARKSNKEFIQYLHISLGSCIELETQIIIAKNLTFATESEIEEINKSITSIGKMLNGLLSSIKKRV
jgi:four helix bundle protein